MGAPDSDPQWRAPRAQIGRQHRSTAECLDAHRWDVRWAYEQLPRGGISRAEQVITPPTCPACGKKPVRLHPRRGRPPRSA